MQIVKVTKSGKLVPVVTYLLKLVTFKMLWNIRRIEPAG